MNRYAVKKGDRRVRRSVFSINDFLLLLASVAFCVALIWLIRILPPDIDIEVNELSIRATWLLVILISAVDLVPVNFNSVEGMYRLIQRKQKQRLCRLL